MSGSPPARRGVLPAFAAVSFCYFAYAGLFGSYAPLWFQHLGFSALAIGTLVSLQSATRVFTPYVWAWLADHSGERGRLLRLAVLASLVASLGLLASVSYAAVALVAVVLFLCTSGVIPLAEAALAQWVSRGGALDAGRYGRVRMWGSVGFIATVSTCGFVLQALGVGWFPVLVVVLLAALGVAAWRLPAHADAPSDDASPVAGALVLLRRPEVAWFFAGVFFTVLAHGVLYAFFSLYLAELGHGKGAIGLFWALGVLVEVAWFRAQGRWFASRPAHQWLLLAAVVTALRFAAVAAFADQVWVLVLAQCTHAITFALQHTACVAVVSRHFDGRMRGRGQALYTVLGYGVSGVVAGVAGGAIVECAGYAAVFWAASAAGVLAAGCSWRALVASQR